jgi:polyhydroxyalkanoate synthesis regulator phasin
MWSVAAGTAGEDRLTRAVASSEEKRDKAGQARAESVRAAAAQAVAAAAGQAQMTRDRAQELADDLVSAAQRVREALEGARPPSADDVRDLRARLDALEARVAALETAKPAARSRASGTRRRPPAS